MSTSPVRIPSIIASYLSNEPFPQKVAKELREHFSNANESHKARARDEHEMAYLYFRKEVISSASIYRMTDEILINHVSVYFTLRDLNAARIACSRWYSLLSHNIGWQCQIPRFIPLCVMPLPEYLHDTTIGTYAQVKLIFIERRIACLNEAGASISSVNTYRDLVRAVDAKKDQLASNLYIFAGNGQIDLVRIILHSTVINKDNQAVAVREAAEHGHLSVVQELLKGKAEISQEDRGDALYYAARNGHLSVVQELLKDGAIISQDDRDSALQCAGGNGHLIIVQELLKGDALDQVFLGRAFCNAALRGHLLIIQEFLKNRAVISQKFHGYAVNNAARLGHLMVVQELLKNGAILSQEIRGGAVVWAACNGHIEVVQELLNGGEISLESRQEAIQKTTNQVIIDLLIQE